MEKKHFQEDYMFGMRQLKGLKLSQIILKYVNILSAKFDFEKSEGEQSQRGVSTNQTCNHT